MPLIGDNRDLTSGLVRGPWPLVLANAGVAAGRPGTSARAGVTLAIVAASVALATALSTTFALAFIGPVRTGSLARHGIGFSFYLDALSAAMFVLVAFVGLIVTRYSRNWRCQVGVRGRPWQATLDEEPQPLSRLSLSGRSHPACGVGCITASTSACVTLS